MLTLGTTLRLGHYPIGDEITFIVKSSQSTLELPSETGRSIISYETDEHIFNFPDLGRVVCVDQNRPYRFRWDQLDDNGNQVPKGAYFAVLRANGKALFSIFEITSNGLKTLKPWAKGVRWLSKLVLGGLSFKFPAAIPKFFYIQASIEAACEGFENDPPVFNFEPLSDLQPRYYISILRKGSIDLSIVEKNTNAFSYIMRALTLSVEKAQGAHQNGDKVSLEENIENIRKVSEFLFDFVIRCADDIGYIASENSFDLDDEIILSDMDFRIFEYFIRYLPISNITTIREVLSLLVEHLKVLRPSIALLQKISAKDIEETITT